MPTVARREDALTALIREVRTCFNLLRSLAERLHQDLGVNPSLRAVMESLASGGPSTVPEIARSKGVSRQHIQTIVNSLLEEGFVEAGPNPAHRRSPQFRLTRKGLATFARIQSREHAPLRRMAAAVPAERLCDARSVLLSLNEQLEAEIEGRDDHAR